MSVVYAMTFRVETVHSVGFRLLFKCLQQNRCPQKRKIQISARTFKERKRKNEEQKKIIQMQFSFDALDYMFFFYLQIEQQII